MNLKSWEIGYEAPDFTGKDQNGRSVQLKELLKTGKVVLIFYRGQWCPFCMPHIRKLQDGLKEIESKGASVILITPEKQEFIQKTIVKTQTTIPIIWDEDFKIMKAYRVAYEEKKWKTLMYRWLLGGNFKKAHSDGKNILPVPATYVIGTDEKIQFCHFNTDYKNRAGVKDILNHL